MPDALRSSRRHVVLVGMMGSGKTTVGSLLAARLERDFADSDQLIEGRTGRTVREIFEDDGEDAFREIEAEVLLEALARAVPTVIAAAGGAVLAADNRRAMTENASVVWLRADAEVLADRAAGADHRPLLGGDPLAVIERLAAEREALYREVADKIIDVGPLTPADVVEQLVEQAVAS